MDSESASRREAIFQKMDKRHEENLANKERGRDLRSEQSSESKNILAELNAWSEKICEKIDAGLGEKIRDPDRDKSTLDEISAELQKFDGHFVEKSPSLAKYDIKVVQNSIVDVRAKFSQLQDHLQPPKKFGFKGRKKREAKIGDTVDGEKVAEKPKNSPNPALVVDGFRLENRTGETICIEANLIDRQDVMLTKLRNCTVRLTGCPVTLHATNLTDCRVVCCGPVETSVYLEACDKCEFSLTCQQLRTHSSHFCDIYLHVTSKAIVEDCDNIRVAPYNVETVDEFSNDKTNNWDKLDDFNWLATDKPSPNWSVMPVTDRKTGSKMLLPRE